MYVCVRMHLFSIAVDSAVTVSSITLLWVTPQSVDEASIASYVITLSPVQDTSDAVTYTLPGSRQSAALGDLHPGVTYQVQLKTETTSGFQPFYSANVTTLSRGVSESVESAILGAGVMLVIVLVVGGLSVVVGCIAWRKMRSRAPTV